MGEWVAFVWAQVWPNLITEAMWVPIAWLYHRWMKRHLAAVHTAVEELRELSEKLHHH